MTPCRCFKTCATLGLDSVLEAISYRELRARGVSENLAWRAARFARSWWHVAAHHALHTALPGAYFDELGVPRLTPY